MVSKDRKILQFYSYHKIHSSCPSTEITGSVAPDSRIQFLPLPPYFFTNHHSSYW